MVEAVLVGLRVAFELGDAMADHFTRMKYVPVRVSGGGELRVHVHRDLLERGAGTYRVEDGVAVREVVGRDRVVREIRSVMARLGRVHQHVAEDRRCVHDDRVAGLEGAVGGPESADGPRVGKRGAIAEQHDRKMEVRAHALGAIRREELLRQLAFGDAVVQAVDHRRLDGVRQPLTPEELVEFDVGEVLNLHGRS